MLGSYGMHSDDDGQERNNRMNTLLRSGTYLPIAAMILTAALANPAAAQTSCAGSAPGCFKGIFQGQDAHDTLPPGATTVVIRTTATGTGTHLGRFSLIREITGNLVNFSDTGSAQWIAANRDSIYTTIVGQANRRIYPAGSLKSRKFIPLLVGRVDSREPRGALPWSSFTSWKPVG
jgi:hypothetical protein